MAASIARLTPASSLSSKTQTLRSLSASAISSVHLPDAIVVEHRSSVAKVLRFKAHILIKQRAVGILVVIGRDNFAFWLIGILILYRRHKCAFYAVVGCAMAFAVAVGFEGWQAGFGAHMVAAEDCIITGEAVRQVRPARRDRALRTSCDLSANALVRVPALGHC